MINGYIDNNGYFEYQTDLKTIDNKLFFLAIDGNNDEEYFNKLIIEYKKDNSEFFKHIKDFISIYLYDKTKKELLIINDRIGAKKVYYHYKNNKLYFSNSLNKLINKYKISKNINIEALSMYFRHHFINEPNTIYKNIYKLSHGNYLIYKDGKKEINNYWNIVDIFNNRKIIKEYSQVEDELNKLLVSKVEELTNNIDNTGIYLSSGIDSSLITAIYKQLYPNNTNTFSLGFEIEKYNETNLSKKIADYLKINHHELVIPNMDSLETVKKIAEYYEEPFGDSSAASTIILNEFAKNNGIHYALTGDGADQLFCGVLAYDFFYKVNKYSKIINPLHIHVNGKIIKNSKLFYIFASEKSRSQIDIAYYEKRLDGLFVDSGQKRFEYPQKIKTSNLQEERMVIDLDTFMAERVLPKMCIAASKNGINIIPPYLSHEIIEYSFKIPHKYKYYKKNKKYILKQLLFKRIPKDFYSNKKKGFGVPVTDWLKTTLNKDLYRVSSKKYLKKQNIFNYEKVQSLINNIDKYPDLVWDYYMFQLWYEKNINNN